MLRKKSFGLLSVVGSLSSVVLLSSCSMNDNPAVDPVASGIDQSNWAQTQDEAFAAFADARAEFFKGVPSVYSKKKLSVKDIMDTLTPPVGADSVAWDEYVILESKEIREIPPEEFDVAEKLTTLAWEAQYTGNSDEIIAYMQEKGLYNKYQDIARKYNIEQHAKNLSMCKKGISLDKLRSSTFIDGDIFLKYDNSYLGSVANSEESSAILFGAVIIPGTWKHAAFLDTEKKKLGDNYFLLSASNRTDKPHKGLGRVGYDEANSYWTNADGVRVDRVKRASAAERRQAIVYAKQFIDTPFGLDLNRQSNKEFYCSKLVYRG